jgi:hypothetical protein
MTAFDGTVKSGFDQHIESMLTECLEKAGITHLEAVHHFPVYARRQNLKRFLAHSELFRMTLDVPGDIAELGVFRGLGLFTWANLLEAYSIGDRTKTVYGFDNWRGFEEVAAADGGTDERMRRVVGGYSPADFRQSVEDAIAVFDADRFIPQKPRIKLIDGNIAKTAGEFTLQNPGVRFSLIHFDCDMYEPTKAGLEALWPRLVRGGVVIFDEYAIKEWPGETQAVDEFLAERPELRLRTFDWTNSPGAYLVKP